MAFSPKVQERIDKIKSGEYKLSPSGRLIKVRKKVKKELTEEEKAEKERLRRERISAAYKARKERYRQEKYREWLKEKHKEMAKRKREEEKEKAKKRKEQEKLRAKKAEEKKKRKPGRPKKPGPKKKRKSRAKKVYKPRPVFDYKIVLCHNGRQIGHVGQYFTEPEAHKVLEQLQRDNKKVIYPQRVNNGATISNSYNEYLLLQKNRYGDKTDMVLRNQYGKLVQQESNSKKWVIIDKVDCDIEETFWVWGCNPATERKTFEWIYDNVIMVGLEDKYQIKRIFLYKNKLVIKDDENEIRLVLCKNVSDAVRFYNLVEGWKTKRKNKQIFMMGRVDNPGAKKKKMELEIQALTGWDMPRIQQSSTVRHSRKKL